MPLLGSKVVLVSGGTQGVGAGVARAAVREGAAVALLGRNRERGEALVAELTAAGAAASFVPTDVADAGRRAASVGRGAGRVRPGGLPGQRGRADRRGTLLDTTPELFDAHIAVNLQGAVLPHAGRGAPTWWRAGRPARS